MMQITALFDPAIRSRAFNTQMELFNKHVGSSSWWSKYPENRQRTLH